LRNGASYIDPRVTNSLEGEVSVHEECEGTGDWVLEYSDNDGGCYVTTFSGPMAEQRARGYYEALRGRQIKTLREV
jgi:hypothetical protein